MRLSKAGCTVAAGLTLALAGTAAAADDIDRFIAQQRQVHGGVIRDGQLVEQRAAGLASIELQVAATTGHVFEIGSIAKQFTAWAVLMLRSAAPAAGA